MRIAIAAALLLLTGCSVANDCRNVQAKIAAFHDAFNKGDVGQTLSKSNAVGPQGSKLAQATLVFAALRKKLGAYVTGQKADCRVKYRVSGKLIVVRYRSLFESGPAQEVFTFRGSPPDAWLSDFHVYSKELATK